jgi:hypothetical protein
MSIDDVREARSVCNEFWHRTSNFSPMAPLIYLTPCPARQRIEGRQTLASGYISPWARGGVGSKNLSEFMGGCETSWAEHNITGRLVDRGLEARRITPRRKANSLFFNSRHPENSQLRE